MAAVMVAMILVLVLPVPGKPWIVLALLLPTFYFLTQANGGCAGFYELDDNGKPSVFLGTTAPAYLKGRRRRRAHNDD
ncbi:MAG: hypothetical protein EOL89_09875 [Actinobacteria bacterium]|nr:hypothetical protein [Actinomycetota bacterium]